MAAEILANELGLDLYTIDLSGVSASTSARPKRTWTASSPPESANAILFFDEADALFGKRSEVRDSTTGTPHRDLVLAPEDGAIRRHCHPRHQQA